MFEILGHGCSNWHDLFGMLNTPGDGNYSHEISTLDAHIRMENAMIVVAFNDTSPLHSEILCRSE